MEKHAASAAKEIAFVDPGVSDLSTLLSSLRGGVRAILLSPAGDAVRQIAAALDGVSGLQAIHIVAHGAPGEIVFSSRRLTLDSVFARRADLAAIGAALATDGELLVW